MDAFSLIQDFFTQMKCHFCEHSFEPEDISLIRQEDSVFIVNVFCNRCNTQNGIAMVGLGSSEDADIFGETGMPRHPGYEDPELTEAEIERLSEFAPISANDVIEAHDFFKDLDKDWMKHIPAEFKTDDFKTPIETPES